MCFKFHNTCCFQLLGSVPEKPIKKLLKLLAVTQTSGILLGFEGNRPEVHSALSCELLWPDKLIEILLQYHTLLRFGSHDLYFCSFDLLDSKLLQLYIHIILSFAPCEISRDLVKDRLTNSWPSNIITEVTKTTLWLQSSKKKKSIFNFIYFMKFDRKCTFANKLPTTTNVNISFEFSHWPILDRNTSNIFRMISKRSQTKY